jgi:hypothetical protein
MTPAEFDDRVHDLLDRRRDPLADPACTAFLAEHPERAPDLARLLERCAALATPVAAIPRAHRQPRRAPWWWLAAGAAVAAAAVVVLTLLLPRTAGPEATASSPFANTTAESAAAAAPEVAASPAATAADAAAADATAPAADATAAAAATPPGRVLAAELRPIPRTLQATVRVRAHSVLLDRPDARFETFAQWNTP